MYPEPDFHSDPLAVVAQDGEFIEVFLLPFAGLYSALVVCSLASLMLLS
jgi:hypothetical protein